MRVPGRGVQVAAQAVDHLGTASLLELFDKVLAIPGVAELLKPTIDALRAKLAVLTV